MTHLLGSTLKNALASLEGRLWKPSQAVVETPPDTFFLRTISYSTAWTPNTVTKSGGTLTWTVYDQNGVQVLQSTANKPTFNLSSYPGVKTMVVTSPDGWSGFTSFVATASGGSKLITDIDPTYVTGLTTLSLFGNTKLSFIDVTQNVNLVTLDLTNNLLVSIYVVPNVNLVTLKLSGNLLNIIDVSTLTLLETLTLSDNTLVSMGGIANLTYLTTFDATNNLFSSPTVNAILADLVINEAAGDPLRECEVGLTENSPPTGQGLTDVTTLLAAGWAVNVDA